MWFSQHNYLHFVNIGTILCFITGKKLIFGIRPALKQLSQNISLLKDKIKGTSFYYHNIKTTKEGIKMHAQSHRTPMDECVHIILGKSKKLDL